jgi:hypothetical protein
MQRFAVKFAADQDAFAAAVTEFYDVHQHLVAETLRMSPDEAAAYCAGQAAQALNGIKAIENWVEPHYAAGLAAWALEEVAA